MQINIEVQFKNPQNNFWTMTTVKAGIDGR